MDKFQLWDKSSQTALDDGDDLPSVVLSGITRVVEGGGALEVREGDQPVYSIQEAMPRGEHATGRFSANIQKVGSQ